MKLKATVGALAATLAISVAPVHASVVAMADLAISNFLLVQLTGEGQFTPITGVNITSEGRTGNATSLYNGVPGPGPTSVNVVGTGTANVPYQCSGDCVTILPAYAGGGGLENNFTTHITTPIADYALGDMVITGTAIQAGANALTRANAASTGGANNGNANATILNGVTATTTFEVGSSIENAAFFLNYDVFVKAFVSGDAVNGFASAGNIWSLSVSKTSGTPDFATLIWSPSELNVSFTANDLASSDQYGPTTGFLFSPTRTLTAGTYSLTILQASNATIDERVPEPGTLLLAGLALAGLGVARRRRS